VALPPQLSSVSLDEAHTVFTWSIGAGETYQLEYKDDLSDSSWTALGNPLTGSGAVLTMTNDFSSSENRFFRLRVVP
jgi:hypothetical protein